MADNVTIPATGTGTATPVIATDDVGGVQYQRVKLDVGGDGLTVPVTTADPLPVVQTGTPGLPTGAATETTLAALNVLEGAVTETAPASDTASSGLNGRLQRVAQRLTSLIALLPAALGAGGGVKVDGSGTALPVSGTVTATVGTVTAVTTITNVVHVDDNAGSLTVDGSVTANAGTNLNTSALALEAGNLATAVASLSVLDDWDETDRAKVNPIAGQAGVQGGAGAVSALTQRVVLATDQTVIPISDNSGSLTVDGTVAVSGTVTVAGAVTNAGTFAVQDSALTAKFANAIEIAPAATTMTAGAYTALDQVGTLLTFASVVSANGRACRLESMYIGNKANTAPLLQLWLFNAAPTLTSPGDNNAWQPTDADMATLIDVIDSGQWYAGAATALNQWNRVAGLGRVVVTAAATSIYGYLVLAAGGALTGVSTTDITVRLVVTPDV